jgi:hypothetical protein
MTATEALAVETITRRPKVSRAWNEAGFGRDAAADWQRAGWHDPGDAAEWLAASPADGPDLLRSLHDAGYTPEQLRQAGRFTRSHVGAWTAALLPPADGGPSLGQDRAVVAQCILAHHDPDHEGDIVIDLR